MIRKVGPLWLAVFIVMFFVSPVLAAVSSTELIENPQAYDGTSIQFQGEAIGDVMERGAFGWVNLHDGSDAIGIWAPAAELRKIQRAGDYNHIGDTVLVEGVFRLACPEHSGEFDIHAESLTIVERGHRVVRPIDTGKVVAAIVLVPIAAALFFAERYRRRHLFGGS